MGMLDLFKFTTTGAVSTCEIPAIYKLETSQTAFVRNDVSGIYTKILTDCLERTDGIPENKEQFLWDNCLQSESNKGLLSLLAAAMTDMTDLFLVFRNDVLRLATDTEQKQIRDDYKEAASSKTGVFVSFKGYERTEFLRVLAAMEYSVLASLNKTLSLSAAIQMRMSKMRESVGLVDSGMVVDQARSMAEALGRGNDVLMDGEDQIITAVVDMGPTEKAITFLDSKRAFQLSLPLSYINGEQTAGIGSTGENDMRAVERGLKQYWFSIIKPVLKALFDITVTYKSQDFRTLGLGLEAAKSFELISDDIVSLENKRSLTTQLLGVPNDMAGKPREEVEAPEVDENGDTGGSDEDSEEDSAEKGNKTPGDARL